MLEDMLLTGCDGLDPLPSPVIGLTAWSIQSPLPAASRPQNCSEGEKTRRHSPSVSISTTTETATRSSAVSAAPGNGEGARLDTHIYRAGVLIHTAIAGTRKLTQA